MSKLHGCNGALLRVNLTNWSWSVENYGDDFRRLYLGGWGFIAWFLLNETPPNIDPLSPENLLIFANGTITGNAAGGSGRSAVGAKSPLTGGFGEADVGGFFGAELARTGFDGILITGRSPSPVYLWIHDQQVEFRPADHLWGLLTAPVQEEIRAELDDTRIRVAQIGPAGELCSPIASIMHDVNRAAARNGLGAVMGSKNLKAIAVRGTQKPVAFQPAQVNELARWYTKSFPTTWAMGLQVSGTAGGVPAHQFTGGLPSYNWREGIFDGWEALSGDQMTDTILKERDTCFACPVRCKRVVEVTDGEFPVDPVYGGPEYESIGSLGSMCGVADLRAVSRANQLCNAYGLDTISTGNTIAWAMDCFERGLITTEDTNGLELHFGDARMLVQLVEMMGQRVGFGRILSEGSLRAARIIGRGSERYTVQVKGQEVPMHEPRVKYGLGIGYAVSPTGADHNHNFHDSDYTTAEDVESLLPFGISEPLPADELSPAKMRLAAVEIPWALATNLIGFCLFVYQSYERTKIVDLLNAITGWDMSLIELHKAGVRAYTLARVYNLREGFTNLDDRVPDVFLQPFQKGPSAGKALDPHDVKAALENFYKLMGWDPATGVPTSSALEALGIDWVLKYLPPGHAGK